MQINLPDKVAPSSVHVTRNGTDVTSAFAVRANGEYQGLVTGLVVGDNELVATMANGPALHLTITNHPSGGPVFAGPQVQPWICRTIAATATDPGFPAPADAQCNSSVAYTYMYMDAVTHTFKPYDPAAPPAPARSRTRRPTRAPPCRTSCGGSAVRWTAGSTTSRCSPIPPRRGRRLRRSPVGTTRCSTSSAAARHRGISTARRRTT